MPIQTKTMVVKSDTALAETKTTIRDTVTFDTSKLPNGITYKGLKAVLSFADPIQWNRASTYDSLTVVWDDATHASYASKRPVPQNIELTNEFYWFRTADLDAQVEMYRQEVMEFDGRITANAQAIADETNRAENAEQTMRENIGSLMETSNKFEDDILIIGDSWSEPQELRGSVTWTASLDKYIKRKVHNYARGGAKVVGNNPAPGFNGNFLGQINSAINDSSYTHTDIGTIILFGGVNDYRANETYSSVISAFTNHVNMLHNNFPNARIFIVLNHESIVSKDQWSWINIIRFSLHGTANTYTTFNWFAFPAQWNVNDYTHPTQGLNNCGASAVRENMLAILNGGVPNTTYSYNIITLTDTDGNSFTIHMDINVDNDTGHASSFISLKVNKNINIEANKIFQCRVSRSGEVLTEGWTASNVQWNCAIGVPALFNTELMMPVDGIGNNARAYFSGGSPTVNDVKQQTDMNFAWKFSGITSGTSVPALFSTGIPLTPYQQFY